MKRRPADKLHKSLRDRGLVDENRRLTEAGHAYVDELLADLKRKRLEMLKGGR